MPRHVLRIRSLAIAAALSTALAPAVPSTLGAQPADTTRVSVAPLFTRRDAVLAGAFALATAAVTPADRWFASRSQQEQLQKNRWLRNAATGVRDVAEPGAFIIGATLYTVGRIGASRSSGHATDYRRAADLGLHGTEAVILGLGTVAVLKGATGRARPLVDIDNPRDFKLGRGFGKDDRYRSFPSGHTVMAFSAAAAVTSETGRFWPGSRPYIGLAMYGGASLVGLSRMYDNKHWASDVLVGAAIGTFAGQKVVRYHHSHPKNRLDRWLLSASITPTGGRGVAARWSVLPQ